MPASHLPFSNAGSLMDIHFALRILIVSAAFSSLLGPMLWHWQKI
jgi:hypothetical protein